jgi:hypothetical protein
MRLMKKDALTVFMEGLDEWLKINCYLASVWVGFQVLQFLPIEIAERVIEAFLEYIGI